MRVQINNKLQEAWDFSYIYKMPLILFIHFETDKKGDSSFAINRHFHQEKTFFNAQKCILGLHSDKCFDFDVIP